VSASIRDRTVHVALTIPDGGGRVFDHWGTAHGQKERRARVSVGQLAALIAALAFLLLVGAIAVPVLRLRHTIDAATQTLNDLNDRTGPILGNVNETIEHVNITLGQTHTTLDGVNLQLARIDTITSHAAAVTANVSNLVTVVTSAASSPLAKAAAFGFGVRRAAARRRAAEEEADLRSRMKAERRGAEAGRNGAGRGKGSVR
jgi:uncharacterized protein YoxC